MLMPLIAGWAVGMLVTTLGLGGYAIRAMDRLHRAITTGEPLTPSFAADAVPVQSTIVGGAVRANQGAVQLAGTGAGAFVWPSGSTATIEGTKWAVVEPLPS